MSDTAEDDESSASEFHFDQPAVYEGWTQDEKYDLVIALKYYGLNMAELQTRIPSKTTDEIKAVIDYCQGELEKRESRRKRKYAPRKITQIPLVKWAELLTKRYDYQELQTEMATAIRIIADFENIPHQSVTEDIDFKKIYHYIADAMEGKTLPNDPKSADILNLCLMETAAMSKGSIPKNEIEAVLKAFTNSFVHSGTHILPRPTKDGGVAAIRTLAGKTNYNPFNVPEPYLNHHPSYTSRVPDVV